MNHLDPEQLYAAVFEGSPLLPEAAEHLAQCAACRGEHDALAGLARELAVSRAAAASPAVLDRYAGLYSHVQQSPAPLQNLWRAVKALLTWDSRRQPALGGVRGAGATAYRLLYAGAGVEVELMVESDGPLCQVQGEIVAQDEDSAGGSKLGPALVQWFGPDGDLRYESEAGAEGHFALRGVQRGAYRLAILPAAGGAVEIEALEIA